MCQPMGGDLKGTNGPWRFGRKVQEIQHRGHLKQGGEYYTDFKLDFIFYLFWSNQIYYILLI